MALLWPKREIHSFFKDHSCPVNVLKTINGWDEKRLSRADMVSEVFNALGELPDNGTIHFNLMLESLANWTHFDEYWFKAQQKLEMESAQRKIAALKQAKEINIDRARKRAANNKKKTAAHEQRHSSLEEMRQDFQSISMGSETPQKRGYSFEKFLTKMARFFELKVTESFKLKGTQIDGTIKYDGENYSIEAKWHARQLSNEPLMAFCHKQESNMHGRGIFISINGFTEGALSTLESASIKNTVLVDG